MAEVLETTLTPIDAIKPHPENVRRGNLEALKESLQEHGQYRAVVVRRSTAECLAGNHTWKAMKDLGKTEIYAEWIECSDADARKILLVDNRLNDLATYDDEALTKMLEEMMLAGQLRGTGYTPDAVDDMLSRMDQMPQVEPEFDGGHSEDPEHTAARYPAPEDVQRMRQFVVLIPEGEKADTFAADLKKLSKIWGIDSTRDLVVTSVHRCAEGCGECADAEIPPKVDED